MISIKSFTLNDRKDYWNPETKRENAKRAHPERDRRSGILQYALEQAFMLECDKNRKVFV